MARSPHKNRSTASEEFLLKEYEHLADSFWKNESAGEQRLSFSTTLVAAVIAALVALAKDKWDKPSFYWVYWIATFTIVALGLLGWLLMCRMVHRNHVTDEYKRAMDSIRFWFTDRDQRLRDYWPLARRRPLRLALEFEETLRQCERVSALKERLFIRKLLLRLRLRIERPSCHCGGMRERTADLEHEFEALRAAREKLEREFQRNGYNLSPGAPIFPGMSDDRNDAWIIDDFKGKRTYYVVRQGNNLTVHKAPPREWPRGSLAHLVAMVNSLLCAALAVLLCFGPPPDPHWHPPLAPPPVWPIVDPRTRALPLVALVLSFAVQWCWIESKRTMRVRYK